MNKDLSQEPKICISDKTKETLEKAISEKDIKTEKWIRTSITKGYEGVGLIPFIRRNKSDTYEKLYVLGINKKGEAEYPGGKCEDQDENLLSTVQREMLEETGVLIEKNRFINGQEIVGGTTGYPSYVFIIEITEEEYNNLSSPDKTFSKFILVKNIIDCEKVIEVETEKEFELRKFNRKYVIPQIRDYILKI